MKSTDLSCKSVESLHSPEPMLDSMRSSSRGPDSEPVDFDDKREPASGPQTLRAASSTSIGTESEQKKQKHSHITPKQLVHLEQFFTMDRSCPAAHRREISERIGMQEHQIQMWFQNQ